MSESHLSPVEGSIYFSNYDTVGDNFKIYVPAESVEAYKSAENWSDYVDYIVPIQ